MKILVPGDPRKAAGIKKFSCRKCGCVFEAGEREYKIHCETDEVYAEYYSCICPTCEEIVYEGE